MTALKKQFGDAFAVEAPLAPLTTLKVGGPARGFLSVSDTPELQRALSILGQVPTLILGRGSNLIIPDEGFRGCVIRLMGAFEKIKVTRVTRSATYLRTGAGVSLPRLLAYTAKAGLSGLEPLVAIPGTVGGAIVMNAGVPGFSISKALSSLTCLRPDWTIVKRRAHHLHPAYRSMRLPKGWIVLHAKFKLIPATPSDVRGKMRSYLERRKGQVWRRYPSAGSIFKNPEGTFAGKLIETCGLKGLQIGGAQVSPDHANIIINRGTATARDILDLIALVRKEVEEKTGITLDLEVIVARN